MPPLDGVAEGVNAEVDPARRVSATYLDTDDLRLTRWGVSLRHRTSDGWTVKLPQPSQGMLLVREELVFAGDARRLPPEALDLVRAYVRTATLRPQVRLRTDRWQAKLRDAEGRRVADVVDDEVAILDGRRIVARFRELEVEIADDAPPTLLEMLVARLREAGADARDLTPKVVRALGPRASQPPEVPVARLGRDAATADVVRGAIAASVDRLIRHDPVMRLDVDPEGVHQARVATRRLRSDLRTFRAFLDPDWARGLREELGWLAGILGAVRDGDVLLDRLRTSSDRLPLEDGKGTSRVVETLEAARDQAHGELLATLRSERYVALLDRLVEAANAPAVSPGADLAATDALPSLVSRPLRTLAKQVQALGDFPSDDELHAVRIQTKRTRYAADAVAPVLGKRARLVSSAAANLQDVLGEHRDAVVAERWLREWKSRSRSAPAAFAAGELAGLERAASERARGRWRKAWKKLSAARPRAWT